MEVPERGDFFKKEKTTCSLAGHRTPGRLGAFLQGQPSGRVRRRGAGTQLSKRHSPVF